MPRFRRPRAAVRALFGLLLVLGAIPGRSPAAPAEIVLFAGGIGDGGPGVRASIRDAYGVAADSLGNVYIADSAHHRIRRVASDGTITTVAGRGGYGFNGDGGAATNAALYTPFGVAVDAEDNVIIADTANHRVRKVTATGVISTIAGLGVKGFAGDGGPATAAKLSYPVDVAVGPDGAIYIVDRGNNRIRAILPDGTIDTVAGNGAAGFAGDNGPAERARLNWPWGVSVGNNGTIFIADTGNHRIRTVHAGIIRTMAGNGLVGFNGDGRGGTGTRLWFPWAVAPGPDGRTFIADLGNNRIRVRDARGVMSTFSGSSAGFAGDGSGRTSARYHYPSDVIFDPSGAMVIADPLNYRIRRISASGVVSTLAGNGIASPVGDGGLATSAQLRFPADLTFDPAGNLYIADSTHFRIRKVTPSGVISTVAGQGTRGFRGHAIPAVYALLGGPRGIAIDAAGRLWIADTGSNSIRMVARNGYIYTVAGTGVAGFAGDGGAARNARFNFPSGIAVDRAGNVFVADTYNHRIRKITPAGKISTIAGLGRSGYNGDNIAARNASLALPRDLAFDATGALLFTDTGNSRIRKISPAGIITTIAGTGQRGSSGDGMPAVLAQLNTPSGVDVDRSGSIIISDTVNNRIRVIDPTGIIRTVAGFSSSPVPVVAPHGLPGVPGDGIPAPVAQLHYPLAAVTNAAGDLFIADTFDNRVRRVDAAILRI